MNKIKRIVSLVLTLACLLYTMPALACDNEKNTDQSCRIALTPTSNDTQTSSSDDVTSDKQPATPSADEKAKANWEELPTWEKVVVIIFFMTVAASLINNQNDRCEHCDGSYK